MDNVRPEGAVEKAPPAPSPAKPGQRLNHALTLAQIAVWLGFLVYVAVTVQTAPPADSQQRRDFQHKRLLDHDLTRPALEKEVARTRHAIEDFDATLTFRILGVKMLMDELVRLGVGLAVALAADRIIAAISAARR